MRNQDFKGRRRAENEEKEENLLKKYVMRKGFVLFYEDERVITREKFKERVIFISKSHMRIFFD